MTDIVTFLLLLTPTIVAKAPPHIVLIVADDLGWNDVSFHGSNQILTPNIDALAFNGLILNQHYATSLCSPSRSALLTGKYPIHNGMQHDEIKGAEPWGLGLSEVLLPQVLSRAGYKSHIVGKWHLGFHRKAYTPTYRGFESHYGPWQDYHNYYDHLAESTPYYLGYDMRQNLNVSWSSYGHHSTEIFTDKSIKIINSHDKTRPLFLYLSYVAPHSGIQDGPFQENVAKLSHIADPQRRVYAARVVKLDESVGEVVTALEKNGMLNNSVIIFISDNGAPTHGLNNNGGSNYPLKGIKSTAWEGGSRVVAAIFSPLIKKAKRVATQLVHVADWMPTLYTLAGFDARELGNIDGMDVWKSLSEDLPSPRTNMLYNIDDIESPYAAFRSGDWKYIYGYQSGASEYNGWYGKVNDSIDRGYNADSVLMSKVEKTDFNAYETLLNKVLLHRSTIEKLRAAAEVTCRTEAVPCDPLKSPCLFNIKEDPCELANVAEENEDVVDNLKLSVTRYRKSMVQARNKPKDCRSNPLYWNNTWTNWFDELDKPKNFVGWNDVSFHGSDQIPTPNIDALAFSGVMLNQHYTLAMCSPSRAALLTGKYPIHTGMQHYVIQESEPRGLSLNETLLPHVLSKVGYESHLVGKWHLGMHKKEQTPLYRGFKSHYGFWQGYQDYYSHFINEINPPYDGYDMRRNLDVDWDSYGKYSTDLFTTEAVRIISGHNRTVPLFLYLAHLAPHAGNKVMPCQAPQDLIDRFSYIEDPERRAFAAMMVKLDESVGEVVSALKDNRMLDNSVIIFISDNGAPTQGFLRNKGSNFPLRGLKATAWEGAHRGVAAIWSRLIKKCHRVSNQLMHITDWLPTISSLAGVDITDLGTIDGIDMWKAISKGGKSPRKEILYNIDEVESAYAAYRTGKWKYVTGYHIRNRRFSAWYGNFSNSHETPYDPMSVLASKTGLSISNSVIKGYLKKVFKRKRNKQRIVNTFKRLLLSREIITKMRKKGKIECNNEESVSCEPSVKPCLFDLKEDPCERVNLAEDNQDIVEELENKINRYRRTTIGALNVGGDCRANPVFWNDTWTFWISELDKYPKNISCTYLKL